MSFGRFVRTRATRRLDNLTVAIHHGDGVNIAARLEAAASPGSIIISRTVHEAVAGRLKAAFMTWAIFFSRTSSALSTRSA